MRQNGTLHYAVTNVTESAQQYVADPGEVLWVLQNPNPERSLVGHTSTLYILLVWPARLLCGVLELIQVITLLPSYVPVLRVPRACGASALYLDPESQTML